MKIKKLSGKEYLDLNPIKILLVLALALIMTGTLAFAEPPPGMPLPHEMFHMMGVSGLSGTQQHLYVLAGGKIMQYSLADLKLLKTVDLVKPVPQGDNAKGKEELPPPAPAPIIGPHGLWAGADALYVLAGPTIYKFSIPDLKLETTVELAKPELPKAAH